MKPYMTGTRPAKAMMTELMTELPMMKPVTAKLHPVRATTMGPMTKPVTAKLHPARATTEHMMKMRMHT